MIFPGSLFRYYVLYRLLPYLSDIIMQTNSLVSVAPFACLIEVYKWAVRNSSVQRSGNLEVENESRIVPTAGSGKSPTQYAFVHAFRSYTELLSSLIHIMRMHTAFMNWSRAEESFFIFRSCHFTYCTQCCPRVSSFVALITAASLLY